LHPTSLPGEFGIGDLGAEAHRFVDFLEAAGQSIWQVLPLGPTGYGDSPYQCFSAFAGNPLMVSPQSLVEEGLLSPEDLLDSPPLSSSRVDFGAVIPFKHGLLERAYQRFGTASPELQNEFAEFCSAQARWLQDYALFRALKNEHGGAPWYDWEAGLVVRDPTALALASERLADRIGAEKFFQWLFFRQWLALKSYANRKGIRIFGDVPIFVAMDSTDVWTQPELFKLDDERRPTVVAGVPPDYFSATGQLWGNPIYDWQRMLDNSFQWWIDRMSSTFQLVDMVRVDHFRGFCACWEIPFGDDTAERGQWVPAPGRELLRTLTDAFDRLPIIAEDLGVITPDVVRLRDDFDLPGMRILQFGFGGDSHGYDLPHNYVRNCVVYTGTHDNDTVVGWFRSRAGKGSTRNAKQIKRERKFCMQYLNSRARDIHWSFVRAVLSSVADTGIVPLQDLLGLDSSARMNLPASTSGNWRWRAEPGAFSDELASRLRCLTDLFGRLQQRPETT
jgi:4-alpha-glucanotransferase